MSKQSKKQSTPINQISNGCRLRDLIKDAELTQWESLEIFNTSHPKLFRPYALSTWKAFLSDPGSARWRPLSEDLLKRAKNIFSVRQKNIMPRIVE